MKAALASSRPQQQRKSDQPQQATIRPRGKVGNHLRMKKHPATLEAQARDAAERTLRGECGLARRLTRTTPAAWKPPGSRGRPLPVNVRREFEMTFSADLSKVRIHDDAASHLAAERENAIAFTSGRDIYLRRGTADKRLLAHEVAHAIQQTATRQSDGRFHVSDVTGEGDLQYERKSPLASTDPIPGFEKLVEIHKAENSSVRGFGTFADELLADWQKHVTNGQEDSFWRYRSETAKQQESIPDKDAAKWQLICDGLKRKNEWEAVVHLLKTRYNLKTAFYSAELFPTLVTAEGVTTEKILSAGSAQNMEFFKRFEGRAADSTWEFLIGPTREIPDIGTWKHHFGRESDGELERRVAPTGLIPNELYFITVAAYKEADKKRQTLLYNAASAAAPGVPPGQLVPRQRAAVAREVEKRAGEIAAGTATVEEISPEGLALYKLFAAGMRQSAKNAMDFWDAAFRLFELAAKGLAFGSGVSAVEVVRTGSSRKEYTDFLKAFLPPVRSLFVLDKHGFPQPVDDYVKARETLAKFIRFGAQKYFELPMINYARKAKDPKALQTALFFGAFLDQLFYLIDALNEYDPDKDRAFGDKYKLQHVVKEGEPPIDKPAPDHRVKHRSRIAGGLWRLSTQAPMPEIRKVADEVIGAKQVGTIRSFLALISDWEEDKSSTYRDLLGDFGPYGEISSWRPIRPIDVVRLYDLAFNTAYIARLRAILAGSYTFEGDRPKPKVAEAHALVKSSLPVPTRYVVTDWRVSLRAEDRNRFWSFIEEHPKTKEFLATKKAAGKAPLTIVPQEIANIKLWIIPTLAPLIKALRTLPALNDALLTSPQLLNKLGRTPVAADVAALPDGDWLELVSAWLDATGMLSKDVAGVGAVRAIVELLAGLAAATAKDLERRVSIVDRFNWVAKRLVPLMDEWDPSDPLGRVTAPPDAGFKGYTFNIRVPDIVANELKALVTYLRPGEDRQLHFALAALELAKLPGKGGKSVLSTLKDLRDRWKMDIIPEWVDLLTEAKKAIAGNLGNLPLVMTSEEAADADFVAARLAIIDDVLKNLVETRKRVELKQQMRYGLQGIPSHEGRPTLFGVDHGYGITDEQPFTITNIATNEQITWKIEKIYADFTYYPAVGGTEAKLFFAGGDDNLVEATPAQLSQPLVKVSIGGGTARDLRFTTDKAILDKLTFAVNMKAIISQLEDLAAMIKAGAELTLDVVEMVPGMQWIMGVRLAISILEFVTSAEFAVMKEELAKNPAKVIEESVNILKELVRPEDLWEYLLFGNAKFNRLHGAAKEPPRSKLKGSGKVGAKLLTLLMRLYQFGKELLGDMGRLQTRVRWKAEAVELFVLRRRLLAALLRFVGVHFDEIVAAATDLAEWLGGGGPGLVDKVTEAFDKWPDQLINMVRQLEDPQLPEEILPMGQVAELIAELVISRLGFKYRMAANVVLFLLEKAGKKDDVFEVIGNAMGPVNPNRFWYDPDDPGAGYRDKVVSLMQDAGYSLASLAFGVLMDLPKEVLSNDQREKFQAEKSKADAKKTGAAAAPYGWTASTPAMRLTPPSTPGVPLSASVRSSVEPLFGQNFSHVRLHSERPAADYVSKLGAAAVTSGSHIYLQPGLAATPSAHSHVLRHELAHVVQQTGPGRASRPPARGSSSFVRHDSALEAQAERMAAGSGRTGAGPSSRAAGVQPVSLKAIAGEFFTKIAGTSDVEHDAAAMAERPATVPQNIRNRTSGLWMSFEKAAKSCTASAPFNKVLTLLQGYLTGSGATEGGSRIQHHMERIVLDSMLEDKVEKDSSGNKKVTYKLDEGRLKNAIERYMLGATGIQAEVTLKTSGGKTALVEVFSIKVTYVHLPVIYGGHELWKQAVTGLIPETDRPKMIPRLRTFLYTKGISPAVWETAEYRIRDSVKKDLDEQAKQGGSGTLDPKDLPPKADYLKADGSKTSETLNHVGLRLGVYNDKDGGNQKGTGRESHHMTQFLLLDFFANDAPDKAFELLSATGNPYPGLEASGSKVTRFKPKTGPAVEIADYHAKRGGKMPCILLSREVHRMPGLHITTALDDLPDAADSPSGVVKGFFKEALDSEEPNLGTDFYSASGFALRTNTAAAKERTRQSTYGAMKKTYHEVWHARMKKSLEKALFGPEIKYYNTLAELKGSSERLTTGDMAFVYSAAVAKLETGLKTTGGWV